MVNNLKPNPTTGVEPNENYARELLQFFSLGTVELGLDGAPLLDSYGKPIPTYSQEDDRGICARFHWLDVSDCAGGDRPQSESRLLRRRDE